MGRIFAGMSAVVLWLAGLVWSALTAFAVSLAAYPFDVSCCTKAELWANYAQTVILALVGGTILAGALSLSVYATHGRYPRWPWIAGLPVAAAAAVAIPLGAVLIDAAPR